MKKLFLIGLLMFVGCQQPTVLNYQSCLTTCLDRGFATADCLPESNRESDLTIGVCVVPESNNCQNNGICQCYCLNEEKDNGAKVTEISDKNDPGWNSAAIDELIVNIKNETRLNFDQPKIVDLEWLTEDGQSLKIPAKMWQVWNAPVNAEMLMKLYFEVHDWTVDEFNQSTETYENQLAWENQTMACVLKSQVFVERGEVTGNNLYQIICGNKN